MILKNNCLSSTLTLQTMLYKTLGHSKIPNTMRLVGFHSGEGGGCVLQMIFYQNLGTFIQRIFKISVRNLHSDYY